MRKSLFMKIGINAAFLRKPATGIGQVTEAFLRRLPQVEGQTYVVYVEEAFQGHFAWLGREDVTVRALLPRWRRDDLIRKIWWEKYTLPAAILADRCDAFISLYQSATQLPTFVRHTMLVHDLIPRIFPEYRRTVRKCLAWWLTEWAIRRADGIVTVSEHTRQDVIHLLGLDPASVRASRLDVDDIFHQEVSVEHRTRVLRRYGLTAGYLYHGGGLEVRKNAEALLQAYKLLHERYRQENRLESLPPLVISGRPRPQLVPLVIDIERRVHELDLGPFVQLIGFIPQADLPAIYAGASLFIYPSRYEGFGMPVLEALSQGVAVIASRSSSLPEVGGDAVAYIDPESVQDIAHAIDRLLMSPEARRRFAEHAREHAREFSWQDLVKDIFATL
jgi:glycosyltransferase involved in cell wall biosynthesis